MSARSLMQCAAGTTSASVPTVPTDPYYFNVSLLLDGNTVDNDPYFSNVSLLLTGDGISGGTTFIDYSPTHSVVTTNGSMQLSPTVRKYRSTAIFFPYTSTANPNYLTVPFVTSGPLDNIQTNWTIEFWFYRPSASGAYESTGSNRYEQFFGTTSDTAMTPFYLSDGKPTFWTGSATAFSSTALTMDMWYHIAIVCNSNTVTCYLNGVAQATTLTFSGKVFSNTILIGRDYYNNGQVRGYLDDIRITKGIARYTTNFSPPASILPTYRMVDTSSNGSYLIPIGGVSINQSTKKTDTGSVSFNGNGGYLYYPSYTTIFNFGSNNWTVEAWVNLNAMPTSDAWPSSWSSHMVVIGIGSYNGADGFNCMIGQTKLMCHNNDTQYAGTAHGMVINTWYHLAYVRSGNTIYFYVNGVAKGSVAFSGSIGTGANTYIGAETGQGAWFNGYIDDLRVTPGVVRYTSAFSVPTLSFPTIAGTTTDPYLSNVSLMLTADSIDVDAYWSSVSLRLTGDDLYDHSNNHSTVTVAGNTIIVSTNKKYGTGSIYFDGTGDYLSIPHSTGQEFGSGNFTIEFWGYPVNLNTSHWVSQWNSSTGLNFAVFNNSGVFSFAYTTNNSTVNILSSTVTVALNSWTYFTVVRSNSSLLFFVNGALTATTSISGTLYSGTAALEVGRNGDGVQYFTGYIDDLRITKGVARYNAAFTPPSASLPTVAMTLSADQYWTNNVLLLNGEPSTIDGDANWANVTLLIDGDTLTDKSTNAVSLTAYGNAAINTSIKKFGTGSMYFDGASDRVAMTNSSVASFTGDFTIECWFYCNSYRTSQNWFYNYLWNSVDSSGGNWTYPYINAAVIYNGTLSVGYVGGTSSSLVSTIFGTSSAISMSTWYHLALVRSSGVISCYLNGVALPVTGGSSSNSSSISQTGLIIGDSRWNTGSESWDGYIDDFRITKDFARYTSAFTPPTIALPSGYGSILDKSPCGLTLTNTGSVSISTTTKKVGTGSMAFSGSNYLTANAGSLVAMGTGDYTVEFWFYQTSVPGASMQMFDTRNAYLNGIIVANGTTKAPYFYSGNTYVISSVITNLYQWYHIAAVRSGTTMVLYLDGVNVGSATSTDNIVGTNCYIGQSYDLYQGTYGYIDDLRVTKGVARYTANFTPPAAALPLPTGTESGDSLWNNVSLLINADTTNVDQYWNKVSFLLAGDTIADTSNNRITLTNNNSVTVSTSTVKYGTGSLNLTGSDKYISFPASTLTNISTGDFTIELWVNFNSFSTDRKYMVQWNNSGEYWQFIHDSGFGASFRVSGYVAIVNQGSNTGWLTGTWYHVALVRAGSTFTIYRNGISIATGTSSASIGYFTGLNMNVGGNTIDAYFDDVRFTKGIARYNGPFTPPTAALPTFPLDKSSNALTTTFVGDTLITSNSIYKVGTGSMYFDGTGDYLSLASSAAFAFGSGNFTMELWYMPTAKTNTYPCIISSCISTNSWSANEFSLCDRHNDYPTKFTFYMYNYSSTAPLLVSTSTVNNNVWYHIAVARVGSTFNMFINGVLESTGTSSAAFDGGYAMPITIGVGVTSTSDYITGYIDDLRITKGVSRYPSSFTVPSLPLANFQIADKSPNALVVVPYGNVQYNSLIKKNGTGSIYFDGVGDCLTSPSNSLFAFGTGDFTVEYWMYYTSASTAYGHCILDTRDSNGNATGIAFSTMNNGAAEIYTNVEKSNAGTATINTWNHYAFVRSAGTLTSYINGVSVVSIALAQNFTDTTCVIGSNNPRNTYAAGYIDELRVTKGVARYTANFVPQPISTS